MKQQYFEAPHVVLTTDTNSFYTMKFSEDAKFMCNPITISKSKPDNKSLLMGRKSLNDLEFKRQVTTFTPLTVNQYDFVKENSLKHRRSTLSTVVLKQIPEEEVGKIASASMSDIVPRSEASKDSFCTDSIDNRKNIELKKIYDTEEIV